MNITTKATDYVLTPEAEALIEEKLRGIERLIPENAGSALLALEVAETADGRKMGKPYRAEVNLTVGGTLYRAEERAATMESALEKVRNELQSEMRKSRGKERSLWKRGGARVKRFIRDFRN